ncbi:MAG: M23 family metallopeptidase, partial [Saprospiraceae bacterium]|nr:M23 family metallopeptidase [Saprospiraceae bacterium]
DMEGRPMKKSFLKSPVQHSRISSFYNLNRFHPILKRRRPHYGTDYAAPHGTPIRAVGSGVISQASYTSGNGNFVKIKHRDNIETQYLHMSKFAKGIKPGAQVDQGDIIGYVGSTGLATGPHVCFRFWKDGKQINHLNLTFPPADPLPESEMPTFLQQRDKYLSLMNIDPATAIVVSRQDDLRDVEKLEDKSPKVASGTAPTSTTPGNSSQED